MAFTLSVSSVDSLTKITMSTGTVAAASGVDAATDWAISANTTNSASEVSVFSVTQPTSLTIQLVVHPELTANAVYTISAENAKDAGLNELDSSSTSTTVPISLVVTDNPDFPSAPLATITHAFGQEFQNMIGILETLTLTDFTAGTDTTLWVETTLAFPSTGRLWMNQQLFAYTGRFDGGFTGVSAVVAIGVPTLPDGTTAGTSIPARSWVRLDMLNHGPEDSL
jgi:hypothetical protein